MSLSGLNLKLKKNIWACKEVLMFKSFLRIHLFSSATVAGGVVLPEKAPTILLVIVVLLLAI